MAPLVITNEIEIQRIFDLQPATETKVTDGLAVATSFWRAGAAEVTPMTTNFGSPMHRAIGLMAVD